VQHLLQNKGRCQLQLPLYRGPQFLKKLLTSQLVFHNRISSEHTTVLRQKHNAQAGRMEEALTVRRTDILSVKKKTTNK